MAVLEKLLRSKVVIWILLVLPGLWPIWPIWVRPDPSVGADPLKFILHHLGFTACILLATVLTFTPLRVLWPKWGIAQALKQCGDDLTRENLLKQATIMKGQRFKMMLPGITLSTTPDDYIPYESLRLAKFEGKSWKLLDATGMSASAK